MSRLKKIGSNAYDKLSELVHSLWVVLLPASYARYYYKVSLNKRLDLNNPKDYNEKVQWLKIYSDTKQWIELADKYKVREYIKQCGLEHILVRLYGVWKSGNEVDFSILPERFVLKSNNGSGKNILVLDKGKLDLEETRKVLNSWVKERYGLVSFQPHYWNIKRRIIAEELLEETEQIAMSSSLIDYKFFCFHGEPFFINILFDRPNQVVGSANQSNEPRLKENAYDLEWNLLQNAYSDSEENNQIATLPRPKNLEEMIRICRVLSKPFPQVRVDLYEVNGKVYFGEFTFTSGGMDDFSDELLLKMGEKIDLSLAKRRKKLFII